MGMNTLKRLVCTLPFVVAATAAVAAEWIPWPTPKGSTWVGAGFKHDDGGSLVIICDPNKKLISYVLVEPRAHWQTGTTVVVRVKADDGTETPNTPSSGAVIEPTQLVVGEESTWDLYIMGQASHFFAVGAGDYARIFPVANLKEATTPVLRTCGDHW
jgi:hypothetical protein